LDDSVVAMLRGTDGEELAYKALESIGASKILSEKTRVLIKPNITVMKTAEDGITTDIGLVEGIIKFAKDKGLKQIAIAEGGGCDVTQAYTVLGFDKIAQRHNARLIDINREEGVLIQVPKPNYISEFWVAKPVLDYDCIISTPKLKIHAGEWQVTLAMKNMMGVLARGKRGQIHREDRGVVDLLQVVKPDLSVIDGIVGGERHEIWSRPVRMDLVIAGQDFVATDAVGSAVMGFSKDEMPRHIRLAQKMGFGTSNIERIKLVGGVTINEVKKDFERSRRR
jgi:uncharacterized protein (DUF362 family)